MHISSQHSPPPWTKTLLKIEGEIGMRKFAVEALNAGFFGANALK
jgi:hypothetical protein